MQYYIKISKDLHIEVGVARMVLLGDQGYQFHQLPTFKKCHFITDELVS